MKKFIIGVLCIILVGLMGCQTTKAQTVKREGKTFIASSSGASSDDVATTYIWKDKSGKEHPIFLHKYTKGEKAGKWGAYVMKVSAKTNKEYKYYIPKGEEIAETIRKEMSLQTYIFTNSQNSLTH